MTGLIGIGLFNRVWNDSNRNYPEISSGGVDIPMWWFPPPSKKYDRSGTYNHGERFRIYLCVGFLTETEVYYRFPAITFTKGNAELDFNTGVEDPASGYR